MTRIRLRNACCLMQCVSLMMHLIKLYFPSNDVVSSSRKCPCLTSPTSRSSSPRLLRPSHHSYYGLRFCVRLRYVCKCRPISSYRYSCDSCRCLHGYDGRSTCFVSGRLGRSYGPSTTWFPGRGPQRGCRLRRYHTQMIRILRIRAGNTINSILNGMGIGMQRRYWCWDSLDIVARRGGAR
jgi:hypothetical protein